MSKSSKRIGVVAGLLALVAGSAAAAERTRSLEHRVAASGTVRIENLAGEIEVVRGAGSMVTVEATVHADAGGDTAALLAGLEWVEGEKGWTLSYPVDRYRTFTYPRIRGTGTSNTRYLGRQVRVRGGRGGASAPVLYADLVVHMPAGSRLEVRNVVGAASGAGLEGDLTLDTGSGRVTVDGFSGRLVADTGSGDVALARLDGEATADTGSGNVRIRDLRLTRLHVDTGSGDVLISGGTADDVVVDTGSGSVVVDDVEVTTLLADTGSGDVLVRGELATARRLRADTGSGDVRILGGAGFEFDLDADQGSGGITVGYDDARVRTSGREVVGARRGSGRTRVEVDTGSGDCVVAPRR